MDWNAAIIAATVANVWTTGKTIKPEDVMLKLEVKQPPTADEIERKATTIAKMINQMRKKRHGRDNR